MTEPDEPGTASPRATFFTIGHSTLAIDEFVALLRAAEVACVVDVRRLPGSRRCPQFDRDTLARSLAGNGIAYEHVSDLGGRRGRQRGTMPETNGYWENSSFHNYADYALQAPFRAAFEQLLAHGQRERCAIMCAESVWWRCHRRIITDYLLLNGHAVDHLMAPGHVEHAVPTPGAQRTADGKVVYPKPEDSLQIPDPIDQATDG